MYIPRFLQEYSPGTKPDIIRLLFTQVCAFTAQKVIQKWANPIRGANFRWICEGYWSRSEQ